MSGWLRRPGTLWVSQNDNSTDLQKSREAFQPLVFKRIATDIEMADPLPPSQRQYNDENEANARLWGQPTSDSVFGQLTDHPAPKRKCSCGRDDHSGKEQQEEDIQENKRRLLRIPDRTGFKEKKSLEIQFVDPDTTVCGWPSRGSSKSLGKLPMGQYSCSRSSGEKSPTLIADQEISLPSGLAVLEHAAAHSRLNIMGGALIGEAPELRDFSLVANSPSHSTYSVCCPVASPTSPQWNRTVQSSLLNVGDEDTMPIRHAVSSGSGSRKISPMMSPSSAVSGQLRLKRFLCVPESAGAVQNRTELFTTREAAVQKMTQPARPNPIQDVPLSAQEQDRLESDGFAVISPTVSASSKPAMPGPQGAQNAGALSASAILEPGSSQKMYFKNVTNPVSLHKSPEMNHGKLSENALLLRSKSPKLLAIEANDQRDSLNCGDDSGGNLVVMEMERRYWSAHETGRSRGREMSRSKGNAEVKVSLGGVTRQAETVTSRVELQPQAQKQPATESQPPSDVTGDDELPINRVDVRSMPDYMDDPIEDDESETEAIRAMERRFFQGQKRRR